MRTKPLPYSTAEGRFARLLAVLISVSFTLNVLAFERETIWPKGKMPDAQAHQIAAMTDEAGAPKFKADKHRVAYLEWFDAPAADVRNGGCMILISGGAYNNCCDVMGATAMNTLRKTKTKTKALFLHNLIMNY